MQNFINFKNRTFHEHKNLNLKEMAKNENKFIFCLRYLRFVFKFSRIYVDFADTDLRHIAYIADGP